MPADTPQAGVRLAALPMYAVPRVALMAFWVGVRRHLVAAGFSDIPIELAEPADLPSHWADPALLFSQTCGYPFVTFLKERVRYVATPCYRAEGCAGPTYRSAILVRTADPAASLGDLRGRRAAFNDRHSQSGMNALRASVAPLARDGRFFGTVVETGAHLRSIDAILDDRADVAAIDAVTWALAKARRPELATRLRVLGFTVPAPSLPFVTAAGSSEALVTALRLALRAACADPDLSEARQTMLLEGVEVLPSDAYESILAIEREAVRAGYPALA